MKNTSYLRTALVVADCAGRVRLVGTEPGDEIVELGDAHLI